MDLDGDGHVHAQVTYPDAASGEAAEKAVDAAAAMAKGLIAEARKELSEKVFGNGKDPRIEDLPEAAGSLLGLGALQHAEDLLDKKPVKRTGDTLAMSIELPPHFKSALGTAAVAGSMYAPANKLSKPGETHYRVLVGGGSMWDWVQGATFAQITDGLSNTWMVVEAEEGVPWTKPDELEFDPKKPLPKLGTKFKGGFHVLYGDGSVRFYRTVPKQAAAMITKSGGEVIT